MQQQVLLTFRFDFIKQVIDTRLMCIKHTCCSCFKQEVDVTYELEQLK